MGYKENKRKYVLEYQKKNYVSVVFHLRRDTDQDILTALNALPNKSDYIRDLIRKDIGSK